jgi:hypothetical protein
LRRSSRLCIHGCEVLKWTVIAAACEILKQTIITAAYAVLAEILGSFSGFHGKIMGNLQ